MSQFEAALFMMLPSNTLIVLHGSPHSVCRDWFYTEPLIMPFPHPFSIWFVHVASWFQHPSPNARHGFPDQFFACAGDAAPKMETQGPAFGIDGRVRNIGEQVFVCQKDSTNK